MRGFACKEERSEEEGEVKDRIWFGRACCSLNRLRGQIGSVRLLVHFAADRPIAQHRNARARSHGYSRSSRIRYVASV